MMTEDTCQQLGQVPSPQAATSEPGAGMVQVLEAHRGERHLVILQDFPDPDAISCAFAHRLISAAYDIQVDILYQGRISHEQNIALVKLLGIDLIRYDGELDLTAYAGAVFVDNQGTTADAIVQDLEQAGVPPLIVVDHHQLQERLELEAEFTDVRIVGAAATIYAGYLEQGLINMQKSRREHALAATALMQGLITDTNNLIRAGPQDFCAAAYLSGFQDPDVLEQIMNQARSKQTMEIIRQALGNRVTAESFTIAGIGYVRIEDRDAIPQAADFLLTEENVHTAVVYGIVTSHDGQESLVGSMRTSKLTMAPDEFIKETFGRDVWGHYFGGGRPAAGGFEIPIRFLAGGGDADYLEQKWQVYDRQIKQRIFAKIGVE